MIGSATAVALLATGTDPAGALLHGAGITAVGVFFVGAGGVAAQVFPARALASGAVVAGLWAYHRRDLRMARRARSVAAVNPTRRCRHGP